MEKGALLRLDANGRLDAKEGSPQHLVEASLRRQGSIATLDFAFHRSEVALKAESDTILCTLGIISVFSLSVVDKTIS